MGEKVDFLEIQAMKRLKTKMIASDIRTWVSSGSNRTIASFAAKAGVSKKIIELILQKADRNEEYNWTRETIEGVAKALGDFEIYYTPPHNTK
jgi:hypothetical protein